MDRDSLHYERNCPSNSSREVTSPPSDGGAGAALSTRVPQQIPRIGAIQALINEGTTTRLQATPDIRQDSTSTTESPVVPTCSISLNVCLDSRSIVAASKFAKPTPRTQILTPASGSSLKAHTNSQIQVPINGSLQPTETSPPPLAAKGPGVLHCNQKLSLISNGSSNSALKPVNGQTLYSGHVKYEPPPIYSRGLLTHNKVHSNSSHLSTINQNTYFSSNNHSVHSDVIIKPHSLANLKIHTYENISNCDGQGKDSSSNVAATIIENKYASPRSSVSSQESKHSSPSNSLVQNLKNSSLERKTHGHPFVHERVSLENLHSTSNSPIFKSQCIPLNPSSLNLNQLPPRIEQDLEGRQFLIPRNNAYVQENARQSNQWSTCSDVVRHQGIYCDHLHRTQSSQTPCCLSCSSHTPISTPIATPSPTLFAPPPPYPGKPASISSLSSSIDLNDSVLSLGSLRSASGVLASVNANHNYANIDVLKGNYISDQQLRQKIQQHQKLKPEWTSNGNFSHTPAPPPYPSSVVRQSQPHIILNPSHHSHISHSPVCVTQCVGLRSYHSYGGHSPALSLASNKSTVSIHSQLNLSNGDSHPVHLVHAPPPPPPYPSSVVRSQLLHPTHRGAEGPSLPPYPSTAVQGIASSCSNPQQPLIASQPLLPSYTPKIVCNNSMSAMDASSKLNNSSGQRVTGITKNLGQMSLSNNGDQTPSERLNKWQNKLNPSYGESDIGECANSRTAAPPGGSSSGGEISDTGSERSAGGTEKPRSKHSGKSLLPYNVTAKTMVSGLALNFFLL